ncbi:glycerol-3-phosphate dehydrogenase/oxidase [Corynebacterium sp. TAE3-ERU12]|uniref:glycerol-3-phosphate dehydrogenase/oxidase n=1 Tax=Corynebacterium sp. TAE3-ERU12 TaxID=2849491 RepID=UPI001C476703|nr:glycerol-3-phosphate dehydrogenase/oxidase [Corynebacterium sp. TAE3-ERU12]MBV7295755.1 glycerol-3-phosphate dehydrogenase/oxidase [Corynebacterium sp. TAE3-ERU12]
MAIPNGNSQLSASRRDREWNEIAELSNSGQAVDLIVIGAGITGVGIALDAASRGMSVVLVEKHDLAFGTSRWSSKLAHGGLRYLATGNVGIARRSARERGALMEHTAPHLVHSITQVVPVIDEFNILNKTLPRMGFLAGDMLRIAAFTSGKTLPPSRTVSPEEVKKLSPTVRTDGLRFGYVNYDGQLEDDARLVTAVARTAAACGARVLTHASAEDATGDQVTITDEFGDKDSVTLHARAVINATGVWAGQIDEGIRVRPSRGTHLVFDAETFGNPTGSLTIPVPGHTNRFCFLLPAPLGRVYLGLTDEDAPGPIPDEPEPTEEEIQFLLDVINRGLDRKVTRADVRGAFAGLRPLIDSSDGSTADLSREHTILANKTGLISIVGGKLTEYRLMAEQAVDKALERMGEQAAPCWTRELKLVGATPGAEVPAEAPDWLLRRFGGEAAEVVRSCALDRPLERVAEGIDVTRAEFAWAVTHEGAMTVADILDRRTRIGLIDEDRAKCVAAAEEALQLASA